MSISAYSQVQTIDWRVEAANGNWDNGGCAEIGTVNSQWWYPHFTPNNARNAPNCSGTYDLVFNNNHELVSNNNINFVDVWAITFGEFATLDRTINGQGIDLIEVSSNNPRIRNLSTANHTINVSLGLGASTEFNPVNGNLTLSGNVFTNNHFIDVFGDNGHRLIINGVIDGTNGMGVQQNSIVELNAVNTYTGETFLNAGAIELGINNAISSSSDLVLSGGDLQTNGFSNEFNNLLVDGKSSIILGAGSHDIEFSNSSGQSWAGGDLTIEGWVGTPGTSGDDGRIFIGTDENGLTQAQLSQISFDGYLGPAILLSTGELVPSAINASLFDDFNRTTLPSAVVGTPSSGGIDEWMEFESPPTQCATGSFVEVNSNGQLELSQGTGGPCTATGDVKMASFDMSGKYSTVFQNAEGVLEWYFNFRIDDGTPSSQNRTAFVLGCDRANFREAGARGYAVAIGESGDDEFHLIRFSDGLPFSETTFTINGNSILNVTPSDIDAFHSIKVTYNPCTDEWTMVVRDDGGSFDNPTSISGVESPVVDVTHVGVNLPYMGVYMRHTTSSPNSLFDNIYIPSVSDVVETYVWNGSQLDNDYQNSLNWTPSRSCTKRNDRLEFNLSGAIEVINIPDQETVGQWILGPNTDLQMRDATISGPGDVSSVVTITGGTGDDLFIPSGATLRFDCGSTDTNDEIDFRLSSGATANIDGTVIFQKDFASGSNPEHKLIATDPGAIDIEGDVIAEELSGNPFGASGSPGSVIFQAGSSFSYQSGSSPFGASGSPQQCIFNSGSTYFHRTGTQFQSAGRVYANFVYDDDTDMTISFGGEAMSVEDLRILDGSITILPFTLNVGGDIEIVNGSSFNFIPTTEDTLRFNGSGIQTILPTGTFIINNNVVIEVNNTNSGTSLVLERDLTVQNNVIITDGRVEGRDVTLTMLGSGLEINVATDGQIVGTNINPGSALGLVIGDGNSPTEVTFTGDGSDCLFNSFEVLNGSSVFLERGVAVQNGTHEYADNTTLQINANGFLSLDSPTYGTDSRLIYNSGGNYIRGVEWTGTGTVDFGYPFEVIIQNGTEVELTNSITTDIGVQTDLNIGDATNGSGTLTMTNTPNFLQVEGDVNMGEGGSTGNLTLSTVFGGDIILGGDWNSVNGTFNARDRAVIFNGSSLQTINNTNAPVQVFDYLIVDNDSDGLVLDGTFTELEVRGSAGVPALELLDGDLNLNGKNFFLGRNGNAIGFEIGDQPVQIFSPSGFTASFNFEGNGNKVISGLPEGSLEFDEDVVVTIASGVDFGPSTTRINATLEILSGGFANNHAPIYGPEGVLIYNTGNIYNRRVEWNGVEGSPGFPNDVIIRDGTTLNAGGESGEATSTTLELRRNLTIESGANLYMDYNGYNMTEPLQIGGDLNLAGVLALSDVGGGDLEISGDWNHTGIFNGKQRRISFLGSTAQTVSSGDNLTFAYCTINNTSDDGVTYDGDISITTELTFNDGIFFGQGTSKIVFEDGSSYLTPSNDSHIDGWIRKIGSDDFVFPTGGFYNDPDGSPQNYLQEIRIFDLSGSLTFDARYFPETHPDLPGSGYYDGTSQQISGCDYWTLDRVETSGDANVAITYGNTPCNVIDPIDGYLYLGIAKYTAGAWVDPIFLPAPDPDPVFPEVSFQFPISNFSDFALTSSGGFGFNVLPIELLSFSAKNIDNREVLLEWSTASETNNDFFTLERSVDGVNFEIIGTVDGAGNSTTTLYYSFVDDDPYSGISYYRLKQTDFDGSFAYSDLEAVEIDSDNNFNLDAVYASDGGVRLIYTSENPFLSLEIFDLTGQLVHRQRIENNGNTLLHPNIARGVYLLRLSNGSQMASEKFFY